MPAFSSDGKHILYYGVDNLGWYRSGRAAYASFNLYMMDADGSNPHRVIATRAAFPLAPPRMLADGKTVTISAKRVLGPVIDRDAVLKYGMLIDGNDLHEDSVILGDITSGDMRTLLPPGSKRKVVADISSDEQRLLYIGLYDLKELRLADVADQRMLRPAPRESAPEMRHASYAPRGSGFAYIQGIHVIIGDLDDLSKREVLAPPMWSPPKPIPTPPILEG